MSKEQLSFVRQVEITQKIVDVYVEIIEYIPGDLDEFSEWLTRQRKIFERMEA